MMNSSRLHKNFKLNGRSFTSKKEILTFSKSNLPAVYSFLSDWFDDERFVSVQTSGSTGKPKIIQLKKEYMVNSAVATGRFFNLSEGTAVLLCLSPDYIAGRMMLVRALVLGWCIDIVEPSAHPLKGVAEEYDFCAMVPLQLENSLKKIHRIKKIIVGGAPVSKVLLEKLQNLSTEIFATYGMTETITHIAIKPLNGFSSSAEFISGSSYKTLPHINISKDIRNCLIINAPKISDAPIITNDIVELISEIEFNWLGRFDSIINSGGVKLIPEQIENKLSALIDLRFFVAGIPDEKLGEKMVLVIEGVIQGNLKSQISNLKSIGKYEIPKEIYGVSQFKETENGKMDRNKTIKALLEQP